MVTQTAIGFSISVPWFIRQIYRNYYISHPCCDQNQISCSIYLVSSQLDVYLGVFQHFHKSDSHLSTTLIELQEIYILSNI
jgi:hypothetical protein